ncbi:MAG: hypothetical protein QOH60_1009 [Mycobacterium sp.]|nr:hypothetical protein [Mycobacterium sp.]
MITLIARPVLGVALIALIIASNRHIFRRIPSGPQVSEMECVYYVIGVASVALAWYFNVRYVSQYSTAWENPVWGKGGWTDYVKLMFANPAASAASQGFLVANLLLLPLYTIVDGYRRGVRRPWLYFVSSWFIPFAFVWAFYLATVDRHRRLVACNAFDLTTGSADGRRPRKRFEMN